jgi:hypothetical protein
VDAASNTLSGIAGRYGQLNPALASRFNVNRKVDGATPTRRAISSSRPRRFSNDALRALGTSLSSLLTDIRSSVQKAKGAGQLAQQKRRLADDIIREWRAESSWNTGRDQIAILDKIFLDSRATSLGIRIQSHNSPKRRSNKTVLIGLGAIQFSLGRKDPVGR